MCDVQDVLESSNGAASGMVSTLYDYGGENFGAGIRRLFSTGMQMGYLIGESEGMMRGSLLTALGIGGIWGIRTLIKRCNNKKFIVMASESAERNERDYVEYNMENNTDYLNVKEEKGERSHE